MPRKTKPNKPAIRAALTQVVRAQLVLWDSLTQLEYLCDVDSLPEGWVADFACKFNTPDDVAVAPADVQSLLTALK